MTKKALRNRMNFLENSKYHVKAYKAKKMWLFAGLFALALGGSAVTANANNNVHADTTNGNSNHVSNLNTQKEQNKSTLVTSNASAKNAGQANVNASSASQNVSSSANVKSNNVTSAANSSVSADRDTNDPFTRLMTAAPKIRRSQNHNAAVNFDEQSVDPTQTTLASKTQYTLNLKNATHGGTLSTLSDIQGDGSNLDNYIKNSVSLPYGYAYTGQVGSNGAQNTYDVSLYQISPVYEFQYYDGTKANTVGSSADSNEANVSDPNSLPNLSTALGNDKTAVEGNHGLLNATPQNGGNASVYTSADGKRYFGKAYEIDVPVAQSASASAVDYFDVNNGNTVGSALDFGNASNSYNDNLSSLASHQHYVSSASDSTLSNAANKKASQNNVEYSSGGSMFVGNLETYAVPVVKSADGNEFDYQDENNNNHSILKTAVSNTNSDKNNNAKATLPGQWYEDGASVSHTIDGAAKYHVDNNGHVFYGKLTHYTVPVIAQANTYQYNYDKSGANEGSMYYPDSLGSDDMPEVPEGIENGMIYNGGTITPGTATKGTYKYSNGKKYYGTITPEKVEVTSAATGTLNQYNYVYNGKTVDTGFNQGNKSTGTYHGNDGQYYSINDPGANINNSNSDNNKHYFMFGNTLFYGVTNVYDVPVNLKGGNTNGNQTGNVPVNGDRLVGDLPIAIDKNGSKYATMNIELASLLQQNNDNSANTTNQSLYVGDTYHLNDALKNINTHNATNNHLNKYILDNYFGGGDYTQTSNMNNTGWTNNPDLWIRFVNDSNLNGQSNTDGSNNKLVMQAATTDPTTSQNSTNWKTVADITGNTSTDNNSDDDTDYDISNFNWVSGKNGVSGNDPFTYNYGFNANEGFDVFYTNYDGDLINASGNKQSTADTTAHDGSVVRWTNTTPDHTAGEAVSGDTANSNLSQFKIYAHNVNNHSSHADGITTITNPSDVTNNGINPTIKVDYNPTDYSQYGDDGTNKVVFSNDTASTTHKNFSGKDTVANDIPHTDGSISFTVPANSDNTNKSTINVGDTVIVVPFKHEINNNVQPNFHYVIPTNTTEIPTNDNEYEHGTVDSNGDFVPDNYNRGNLQWTNSSEKLEFYAYDPSKPNGQQIRDTHKSVTYTPSISNGDYAGRNDIFADTGLQVPTSLTMAGYNLDPTAPGAKTIGNQQYFTVPTGNGVAAIFVSQGGGQSSNDPTNRGHYVPVGPINPNFNPKYNPNGSQNGPDNQPGGVNTPGSHDHNGNGGDSNNPYAPGMNPIPPDNPDTPTNPDVPGNPNRNKHHNIIPSPNHAHADPNNPDDLGGNVQEGPNGTLVPASNVPAVQADFNINTSVIGNDGGTSFKNISVPISIDITTANNALNTNYQLNEHTVREAIVNYMVNHGYADHYGVKGDLWDDSIIRSDGNENENLGKYYQIRKDSKGDYHVVQTDNSGNLVGNGDAAVSVGNYQYRPSEAIFNYNGYSYDRDASGKLTPAKGSYDHNETPVKVESVKAEGYLGMELDPSTNQFIHDNFTAKGWTLNNVKNENMGRVLLTGDDHSKYTPDMGNDAGTDKNVGLKVVGNPLYGDFYGVNGTSSGNGASAGQDNGTPANGAHIHKNSQQGHQVDAAGGANIKQAPSQPNAEYIALTPQSKIVKKAQRSIDNVFALANQMTAPKAHVEKAHHAGADVEFDASPTPTVINSSVSRINNGGDNGGNHGNGENTNPKPSTHNDSGNHAHVVPAHHIDNGQSQNAAGQNNGSQAKNTTSAKKNDHSDQKASHSNDIQRGAATLNFKSNGKVVDQETVNGDEGATIPASAYINALPKGYKLAPNFKAKANVTYGLNDPVLNIPVINMDPHYHTDMNGDHPKSDSGQQTPDNPGQNGSDDHSKITPKNNHQNPSNPVKPAHNDSHQQSDDQQPSNGSQSNPVNPFTSGSSDTNQGNHNPAPSASASSSGNASGQTANGNDNYDHNPTTPTNHNSGQSSSSVTPSNSGAADQSNSVAPRHSDGNPTPPASEHGNTAALEKAEQGASQVSALANQLNSLETELNTIKRNAPTDQAGSRSEPASASNSSRGSQSARQGTPASSNSQGSNAPTGSKPANHEQPTPSQSQPSAPQNGSRQQSSTPQSQPNQNGGNGTGSNPTGTTNNGSASDTNNGTGDDTDDTGNGNSTSEPQSAPTVISNPSDTSSALDADQGSDSSQLPQTGEVYNFVGAKGIALMALGLLLGQLGRAARRRREDLP